MPRITAIINQKGGVAKTTTAAALVSGLTSKGFNVLAIDADAQGSLSYIMGTAPEHGTYEAMKGEKAAPLIISTKYGQLLGSTESILSADLEFTQDGREYLLRDAIKPLRKKFDHIIIDCPPHLGIMTINALTAATDIVIPMGADILSLKGLGQLLQTVEPVKRYCNPQLKIAGLLLTRCSNSILTRDLTDVTADQAARLGTILYNTRIRESVTVRESQTLQRPIYESHPKANPTKDYIAFVNEYLEQER